MISLSTRRLNQLTFPDSDPAAASAPGGVSASAGVFVSASVSNSWECATCGARRQSAARMERQLWRKLPAMQRRLRRGANADSQTRLAGNGPPGMLTWTGQSPATKEWRAPRGQYNMPFKAGHDTFSLAGVALTTVRRVFYTCLSLDCGQLNRYIRER